MAQPDPGQTAAATARPQRRQQDRKRPQAPIGLGRTRRYTTSPPNTGARYTSRSPDALS